MAGAWLLAVITSTGKGLEAWGPGSTRESKVLTPHPTRGDSDPHCAWKPHLAARTQQMPEALKSVQTFILPLPGGGGGLGRGLWGFTDSPQGGQGSGGKTVSRGQ